MGYTYVMSDLHGYYQEFLSMLELIHFEEDDMLYVLGDILDRGPEPIRLLLDLANRPNCVCLVGNHEVMACECLRFLLKEVTDDAINALDEETIGKLLEWQENGAESTLGDFKKYDKMKKREIAELITEFELFEELTVNGQEYLLVHAGLGNFEPNKDIYEYELDELVWQRPDYRQQYYADRIVITGHTPTQMIELQENKRPGYIFKANNHIAIDCGCSLPGGRLGCLRLEDGKEFYIEKFTVSECIN